MSVPPPLGGGRWRGVALVAGFGVAEAAAIGVAAVATRGVFAALHADAGPPAGTLAVLAAAGVTVALLRALSHTLAEGMGQRYAMALRRALYRHLARLPASTVERRRAGAIGLRFVGDLSAARRWISAITRLASGAVVLPGAALALWWLDPSLALSAGAPVLGSLVAMAGLALLFGRLHRRLRSGRARLAIDMMERAAVAPELDLLGRTGREVDRLERAGEGMRASAVRRAGAARLLRAMPEIGVALGGAFMLAEAARSGLPAADVAGALAVLAILALPLRDLAGVRDAHAAWRVAHAKLAAVLETPPAGRRRPRREGPCTLRVEGGPAGAGAALSIPPGEVVTVEAGRTASALIAAAAGLEPLASGRIVFEGRERPPVVAHVGPRSPVLQGSLRRALTMGARRRPEDPALERLARGFGLGRLLDERGLDARLAEDGRDLAEGERLRVLLVRATLREPDLLLVDRPDAAADAAALALIERAAVETGATALIALPADARPRWAPRRLVERDERFHDAVDASRMGEGAETPAMRPEGMTSSS